MRTFTVIGALFGFLGVALGAFGAHALRSRVEPRMLEVWDTAVQYQLVHALALLWVAFACDRFGGRPTGFMGAAGWLFVAGVVLFSGSLYAMTLSGVTALGATTPVGGILLLAGWALLLLAASRSPGRTLR